MLPRRLITSLPLFLLALFCICRIPKICRYRAGLKPAPTSWRASISQRQQRAGPSAAGETFVGWFLGKSFRPGSGVNFVSTDVLILVLDDEHFGHSGQP